MSYEGTLGNLQAAIAAFDTGALQPVQVRMFRILSDMFPHHSSELVVCLYDEQATPNAVQVQASKLRKALRLCSLELVTELREGGTYYRISNPIPQTQRPVQAP